MFLTVETLVTVLLVNSKLERNYTEASAYDVRNARFLIVQSANAESREAATMRGRESMKDLVYELFIP